MAHRFFRPLFLLPLAALMGCGSDPAPAKPKPPDAKPVVAAPAPPTPAPPRLPDGPLPANPVGNPNSPVPLPVPPPRSKELAKPGMDAPTGKRKLDEFDPEVVGGRPIGQWMEMLNSSKKDDIIEAAEALKMVPNKAKKATPRLEELAKNSDKEIAQEASDTLKAINGK